MAATSSCCTVWPGLHIGPGRSRIFNGRGLRKAMDLDFPDRCQLTGFFINSPGDRHRTHLEIPDRKLICHRGLAWMAGAREWTGPDGGVARNGPSRDCRMRRTPNALRTSAVLSSHDDGVAQIVPVNDEWLVRTTWFFLADRTEFVDCSRMKMGLRFFNGDHHTAFRPVHLRGVPVRPVLWHNRGPKLAVGAGVLHPTREAD